MKILVTGGAGYIGSHTVVELLSAGHDVVVLDNYCNSSAVALERVAQIVADAVAGKAEQAGELQAVEADIRDRAALDAVFAAHAFDGVIHFAGLKAVGESVAKPLEYYENNVGGSVTLCQAMQAAGVFNLVFSSSATVYGEPPEMPISEAFPTGVPTNPYGRSKLMVEEVLQDLVRSDKRWSIALLRYFNPTGAHASGLIGEDPQGIPNNLVPYISQVAIGTREKLSVFGGDYPTPDGTGVRDYIHVVDLAKGHLSALNWMQDNSGVGIWNLGTGLGYSVLDMVRALETASARKVPYEIVDRRPGDVAECWADASKAAAELGWKAELGLEQMMADTWRWQSMNPQGYGEQGQG
ncbi:UDP-glucose 4-epimerase GalE [Marinobacterium rhizophilum]|uniref:UDP-glucose 4-epimerase n=1 Tax=Marinobacterium rhizophilum TaxID=420402 RepID=A0ABY5HFN5_9GAMM|nr:UDP-glucose 4-epimerase GalE [Marinobacterium rhizophilum]UTW10627.1 UDP-glucose 4-epimerase GalE [Marinobacterium rhizophilum]